MQISSDGTCQNRRKGNVFKEPDGSIHYNGAFSKRATDRYSFNTKEWTKIKNPICWHGGLFEHKNNVLTGRYFNTCLLYEHDIDKGWMPKETIYIDCVEVEISPDNWIMAVDADNTNLLILSCNYSIQWKKYIEASYKYRTNTDKMTASDYTHLFGYLNPYYRSAYNVSKRRK